MQQRVSEEFFLKAEFHLIKGIVFSEFQCPLSLITNNSNTSWLRHSAHKSFLDSSHACVYVRNYDGVFACLRVAGGRKGGA